MEFQYGNNAEFVAQGNHTAKNILLTGATGFLAGHYLFWRLQLPGTIYVLVRAEDMEAGKQRIYDSLDVAAPNYKTPLPSREELDKKIICVLGDLMEPNCGISSAVIDQLSNANIEQTWHCAANMAFLPKHREKLIHANVSGTKSLMSVSKLLGVDRFIYISTAYTAGNLVGEVPEKLHPHGHTFTNCYEESKFLAEHAVVEFAEKNGIKYNLLRPSMVMGPLESMQSGGTLFGMYGVAKFLYKNRTVLRNVNRKVRLEIPDHTTLNLIPVDQVVFDMLYLDSINFGNQPVYHLSNHIHDLTRKGIALIDECLENNALEYVDKRDSAPTSMERIYDEGSKFAECYYYSEKVFVRSLPKPMQPYDLSVTKKCMENFIVELENLEEKAQFTPHEVESWDGQRLAVYSRGDASLPTVVFVNAYGLPLQFSVPLSRHLSEKYHFVTWDSRWVPNIEQPFDIEKCNSLTHAKDLISILDYLNIDKCALVGWSSGTQVCLRTMNEFPDRIQSAVLMGCGVSLWNDDSVKETEYQQSLRSLFPKVANNPRAAKMYCDMIFGETTKVQVSDQNEIGSMLTSLDPTMSEMTSAVFKDPESLYRYTNMMYRNFEERDDAFTTGIKTPVLVYGSKNDEITHYSVAVALANALENGECYVAEKATHFAPYYDDKVAEMILGYFGKTMDYSQLVKNNNAQAS